MNLTLVNGHVLFALPANRKVSPQGSRLWQSEVAAAVTGAESRSGVRVQPRTRLEFQIMPATLAEQIELSECVMAAKKSGLACAPYHGRGGDLQSSAAIGATSIEVRNTFAWAVGDWIFLRTATGTCEFRQLTAVNLASAVWTLEFATALTLNYPAGALGWPLLFGEFNCDDMTGRSAQTGPINVTITELTSARSAAVGVVEPPGGTGIGVWRIGDTFIVQ